MKLVERPIYTKRILPFVDEVQEIVSFERTLRSLLAQNTCDIYCTGSNANMLSGELATHLSGRYIAFHIHSLSYREFLLFHSLENSQESIMQYLKSGKSTILKTLGCEIPSLASTGGLIFISYWKTWCTYISFSKDIQYM